MSRNYSDMTIGQIIQLLHHKETIYAAIESYYQSLPDDDKEWVDSNWFYDPTKIGLNPPK